ncbi:MAG: hypothetical protein HLUCCO16_07065 [Phormidium sp. OSCR]|nr:MAG: hypothetical protein HLUCCO16_07065 [Phormidium sp. OSCR]
MVVVYPAQTELGGCLISLRSETDWASVLVGSAVFYVWFSDAGSFNFLYSLPGFGCLYSFVGLFRSKMDSSVYVGIICPVYPGGMGGVSGNWLAKLLRLS